MLKYSKLINMLKNLQFCQDPHRSHPEENCLSHVVQAFVLARRESDSKELWVAALFHDIGKIIETHGHENLSVDILQSFGYRNEKVLWLIKHHMRMHWMLSGRLKRKGKIRGLLTNVWLPELVHLRRVDALGRKVEYKINIDVIGINTLLEETNDN